jgi:predicted TPR repeat methyltransferase
MEPRLKEHTEEELAEDATTLERRVEGSLSAAPAQFYASWAKTYDQDLSGVYECPSIVAQYVAELIGSKQASASFTRLTAMDVGCGTGLFGEHFESKVASLSNELGLSIELGGIDICPEMLELAEQKYVYDFLLCRDLSDFRHGAAGLSYEDWSDIVVCVGCFGPGHLDHNDVPTLVRLAKKGGAILFVVRPTYYDENMRQCIDGADGFELVNKTLVRYRNDLQAWLVHLVRT